MKKPNKKEENRLYKKGIRHVAGLDEVGRGALAGPIVGAAVIFRKGTRIKNLKDSKKINTIKRKELSVIIKKESLAWSIFQIKNTLIDKNGIQYSNLKVLEKASQKLKIKPQFLLIDAVRIKSNIPYKSIIKGDQKVFSIAAASILAKVFRDEIMEKLHKKHPQYKFANHKGYGTKAHLNAIKKNGLSPIHRKTYNIKNLA